MKIANSKARSFVQSLTPFKGNNTFAEVRNGIFVVFSYGDHFPLFAFVNGEWFGAPRGIGILIINAMQNFQIVLLWCAVLLAVGASLFFYGLLTLLERAAYSRFG